MSQAVEQTGFDFWEGDDFVPIEKPQGTWEGRQSLRVEQWLAKFEQAGTALLSVAGPGRRVFRMMLEQEREALEGQLQRMMYEPQDDFCLWGVRHELDDEAMDAFIEHCTIHAGAAYTGVQYKVRAEDKIPTYGMHVDGLGSVVVRDWREHGRGVDYSLVDRDTFFLDSCRDTGARYELPYSVWGPAMSCQRLSESGDAVCNVNTFQYLGRDFLVTGVCHNRDAREGSAWSVVPASDWKGKTYTYRSQIAAYNDGVLERGDHRGLLVKVRGALCVVDGYAAVFCKGADAEASFDLGQDDDGVDLFDEVEEEDEVQA